MMDDRIRISDADRERVTSRLREHFAEGRLTSEELEERITAADLGSTEHDVALVGALAQLDPAYRLPILLHYYADLSVDQVAQTMNLTVAATKSRLHRARALLRNSLAESEEAEGEARQR